MTDTQQQSAHKLEASFSTLVLSVASTAAMNLGMAPNPQSGKTQKDLNMAKFNIDLLNILEEKTANNLSEEERKLIEQVVSDLRLQYVEAKKKEN